MKRYITDNTGKDIEVTDINAAIAQVSTYTTFSNTYSKENEIYWKDVLDKLNKLKAEMDAEPVPVIVEDPIADKVPNWVKELRAERMNTRGMEDINNNTKLFVKDRKLSPLYGIYACVKAEQNVRHMERMEIGETWNRGYGSPSLTRIF